VTGEAPFSSLIEPGHHGTGIAAASVALHSTWQNAFAAVFLAAG
jgi:hypothetical protein